MLAGPALNGPVSCEGVNDKRNGTLRCPTVGSMKHPIIPALLLSTV